MIGTLPRPLLLAVCAAALLSARPAWAQDATPDHGSGRGGGAHAAAGQAAADPNPLPAASVTKQSLVLPDRSLNFTATVGAIRVSDAKGEPEADLVVTAYVLDGQDAAKRPVTFVFNGGPGAASGWQQLGNLGPWRLKMTGDATFPSAPPQVAPNADTWLDFTDLVFIDPAGTGYSRFIDNSDEVRKRLFSVPGDIASIAETIRIWLARNGRMTAPKYLLGESYGGFRGPRLARLLEQEHGVGINGLLLVSPVLDFQDFNNGLLHYAAALPSLAAVNRAAKGNVTRADMADVESYAASDFLLDLVKGEGDAAAVDRLATHVSALTGLDPALTHRLAGRIEPYVFRRAFDQQNGMVTSNYDGTVTGYDPMPDSEFSRFDDPLADAINAPMTSALVDLYQHRLNWKPEGDYALLDYGVNHAWNWGESLSPPQSVTQLRQLLALDPKLKVLVGTGLFDLDVPYFGTKLLLDQLPTYGDRGRVQLLVYPGGHMFYSVDASRAAFRAEAAKLTGQP